MEITARRVAFPSRSVKSNNINLTTRKKQWMCFSHINGHGGTRRDVLTNGIQVLVQFNEFGLFKTKTHALAASLRVKYLLNIAGIEELHGA